MTDEQIPQDALPDEDPQDAPEPAQDSPADEPEAQDTRGSLEDRVAALEAQVGRRPAFVEDQAEDDSPASA